MLSYFTALTLILYFITFIFSLKVVTIIVLQKGYFICKAKSP